MFTEMRFNMDMEIGKIYKVRHSRKGVFSLKVKSFHEEWVVGEVYQGATRAMLPENVKLEGDPITVRKSFLTVIEEICFS